MSANKSNPTAAIIEPLEDRRLMSISVAAAAPAPSLLIVPTASVTGRLFRDRDGDGVRDRGDAGLAGQRVFLDADGNGLLDPGEGSTRTRADGRYTFRFVAPGTYTLVRQTLLLPGTRLSTTPLSPITVMAGSGVNREPDVGYTTAPFPPTAPDARLSGVVFRDANGNGVPDAGETLARQVTLISATKGGPTYSFQTSADGRYDLSAVRPGDYIVHDSLIGGGGYTTLRLDFIHVTPAENAVVNIHAQSFAAPAAAVSVVDRMDKAMAM